MHLPLTFKDDLDTADINLTIDRIRKAIKKEYSLVQFVIIQPESLEEVSGEYLNLDSKDAGL